MNVNKDNIVLVYLIIVLVLSCGKRGKPPSENKDAPVQLVQLATWEINAPEIIPHPYRAGILNDSSLILVDRSLNTINHFDLTGRLIQTFGGLGRGPGEYGRITHAAVHPDGRVAVADLRNARITIQNVNDGSLTFVELDAGWHTRLSWVSKGLIITNSPFRIGADNPGDVLMRIYDSVTEIKKQFMHLELALEDPPPDQISCTFCDFRFRDDLSFFTSPQDTSYRIYRVDPVTRETALYTRFGVSPVPLSDRERKEWLDKTRQVGQVPGLNLEDEPQPPTYKERFRGFFPDHKGRLWVLMNVPEDQSLYFDVFSVGGEYIGSVDAPEKAESVAFNLGDQILFRYQSNNPDLWKAGLYRIIDEDE